MKNSFLPPAETQETGAELEKDIYSKIEKEYSDRRLKNARLLEERKEQVYLKVPGYKDTEQELHSLMIKKAQLALSGAQPEEISKTENRIGTLRKKKNELLKNAGIDPGYLEPVYTCSKCKDTGYIGTERCSCFKERLSTALSDRSLVRSNLEEENFETFRTAYYEDNGSENISQNPRLSAQFALESAKSFVKDFSGSTDNLFIYGKTGTGKTFLSSCIAKEILEQGYSVVYVSAVRLFKLLSDAAFNKENGRDRRADHLYDCDLLIIDDMGTELFNSFTGSELFCIINERALDRRHTIISTNLSIEQFRDRYSERIFSRIASNYIMIKLIGDDIRIRKKLED